MKRYGARRLPLRLRIALVGAVAVGCGLAGMAVAAYLAVDHELHRSIDRELVREVHRAQRLHAEQPAAWTPAGPCTFLAAPACSQEVSAGGTVDADAVSEPALPITERTRAVAAGTVPAYYSDIVLEGYPTRLLTAPLGKGRAVQVAVRSDTVEASLSRIALALGMAGAAGILVAALAGFAVARAGLTPVAALTDAAERVAATRDPRRRIGVTGVDELGRLAASINRMLTELQHALEGRQRALDTQRRLVADAAHELRTPLTALSASVDLLGRGDRLTPRQRTDTLEVLRGQSDELTGLVSDLLELARGDDPQAAGPDENEDVRLDTLVAHCLRGAGRNWPGITFEADLAPTVLPGDPRRLARAVTNLLDNAAKFSPAGSWVHVRLAGTTAHGARIAVENAPDGGALVRVTFPSAAPVEVET